MINNYHYYTSNLTDRATNLVEKINQEYTIKKGHKEIFKEYLQNLYLEVDLFIINTFNHLEETTLSTIEFERLKPKIAILGIKLKEIEQELRSKGHDRNFELEEFYKDVNYNSKKEVTHLITNITQVQDLKYFLTEELSKLNLAPKNQITIMQNDYPKYNPNFGERSCYELLLYLIDNYYTSKKIQLVNIWFYLIERDRDKFRFTKPNFISFIKQTCNIEIKNFDRPQNHDRERKIIDSHRINFESK
jgi:hypothetical protein